MVSVLGGGIGGLASAYYLAQLGQKATLIERGSRLGGWIKTIRDPVTGVQFDKGPRTLRVKGHPAAYTLKLVEELGIEDKLLPITMAHPSAKNRMIYVNGQLHLLPSSVSAAFVKTAPFSKPLYKTIFKDLVAPGKKANDDNIYDFVDRRFGKEVADYLISAMICGICAGNAREISVKFLMPHLFELEQSDRSVVIGMLKNLMKKQPPVNIPQSTLSQKAKDEKWSIYGFQGGMETLPQALSEKIVSRGVQVELQKEISRIQLKPHEVKLHAGNTISESKHVISSLPANVLAGLLKEDHPALAKELAAIPFVDVVVVNLAFKGRVLDKEAFGFLIPPSQNVPILGVIFDSCNFDAGDWTVLTVMMGGAWFNKYFSANVTSDELLELAITHTKDILKIDAQPSAHHVSLMRNCIPQYVVGHHDRVDRIQSYVRQNNLPISLVGSSYTGVGVNDVIVSARKAVDGIQGNA